MSALTQIARSNVSQAIHAIKFARIPMEARRLSHNNPKWENRL